MNRLLPIAITLVTVPLCAQTPTPPPAQTTPPPPISAAPSSAVTATEKGHISRVISGPDGHTQGLLLRNGTFVTLSPGLAQRIPASVRRSDIVTVSGNVFSSNGQKTIQAQNVMIAGVTYNDALGAGAPPPPAGMPGAAPPPLPPCVPGAPPPPPPCVPGAPPPPQGSGAPAPAPATGSSSTSQPQ